jgi:hypothetical protein
MTEATQKGRMARLLRSFADSLEGEGTAGATRMSFVGLEG